MSIEIKIKEEPPRELIRVIEEYYGPIELIKEVLIDINIKNLSKSGMGAFNPETGQVILDLQKCLISKKWIDQGLMKIQAVWFNMLRAVYHEGTHAEQLADYPRLVEMQELTPNYEEEAEMEAVFQICGWAEKGGVIPKLDEMGWCGEQLKAMINKFYPIKEIRPLLMYELTALECNGVTGLSDFMALNGQAFPDKSFKTLCEAIDKKELGIKIKGARYLDPLGFFGFLLAEGDTRDKERQAKAAQNRGYEE